MPAAQFIGNPIDQLQITQILDRCLLTDLEYLQGPETWSKFEDTFPPIELEIAEEDEQVQT